jgi:site-specific recombinase XerD
VGGRWLKKFGIKGSRPMTEDKKSIVQGSDQLQAPDKNKVISHSSMRFLEASKAFNTRKAYRIDWQHFAEWCSVRDLAPLPATAEIVGNYLSHLVETGYQVERKNKHTGHVEIVHRDYTAATIGRKIAAISQAHEFYFDHQADEDEKKNFVNPTKTAHVHAVFSGIKRTIGTAQTKKQAATVEVVRALVEVLDDDVKGIRNRAMILIGFAGGFRRSELVAFNLDEVSFTPEGVLLKIRRSKTDQEARGEEVGIHYGIHRKTCPVRSLQKWIDLLEREGITGGALFRNVNRHEQIKQRITADGFIRALKSIAEQAGFDPKDFSGHSLRRGFITTADQHGKSEESIMRQTRHQSIATMRGYLERRNPFQDNASKDIGL